MKGQQKVTLMTLMTLIARLLVQMVTSVEHFLEEKPAVIKIWQDLLILIRILLCSCLGIVPLKAVKKNEHNLRSPCYIFHFHKNLIRASTEIYYPILHLNICWCIYSFIFSQYWFDPRILRILDLDITSRPHLFCN